MVALQCMVVVGVFAGTFAPACGSNDQCHQAGTYCAVGKSDRCQFCSTASGMHQVDLLPPQTDPATGGTLNDVNALDFAGFNLTAVAELCADPSLYTGDWKTGRLDDWTTPSIVSWCKSSNAALGHLIPRTFLAHDKCRSQAKPVSTRSTARWTR
jgi:hypothetical protein